ncbi:outer membrane beta-barrel protein [Echinicola sp. CAU 1574]|uniref:Outer membrane beta-barrel protein n=1 Tax=Echinicola arenosa TaxID=2774144 RepID=A0ABR9AQB8_9BACT|nr:outer membrane beta-barrel protein [Echinicola arenosa]MBD8490053.1 outer membrane beta-barrel protein [Echinicola arenosa]
MKKYIALFGLIFVFTAIFFNPAVAQIEFNHLGIGVSYWNRSYGDLDERFFLGNEDMNGDFTKGSLMPTLSVELGIAGGLALDTRLALWLAKFEGEEQVIGGPVLSLKNKQLIVPFSLGLVYNFDDLVDDKLNASIGAGANRYYIKNKVERVASDGDGSIETNTFEGGSFGLHLKGGLEIVLSSTLGLAFEGRYNMGSYNQLYASEVGQAPQDYQVDINGIEVGIYLTYNFSEWY